MRWFPRKLLKNPQVPIEEGFMSNVEIRVAIHTLTQALSNQLPRDIRVKVNPHSSTTKSSIWDFTMMNPPAFLVQSGGILSKFY